jgi:hypothetical protein
VEPVLRGRHDRPLAHLVVGDDELLGVHADGVLVQWVLGAASR